MIRKVHQYNIALMLNYKGGIIKPLDILNKICKLKLSVLFSNISVALRIFLTLPVTVATAERSFSKLSYIKNKLRNSYSQYRLVYPSIIGTGTAL